jgi:membrane-bound lytic murein transglycosylase MltF
MWSFLRNLFKKKNVLPPPIVDHGAIEKQIDDVVMKNISKHKNICNFKNLKYWQSLIKAVCFAESNFNPNEIFYEKTMGYNSCGLMQLSVQDSKYYPFNLTDENIFDVEKNISAGMIILNRLMPKYCNPIFNDGNYWAVLQPKNKRHQIFLKKFNEYMGGI